MAMSTDDEFGRALPSVLCGDANLRKVSVANGHALATWSSSQAAEWSGSYRFASRIVLEANRLAMNGIYSFAGRYRDGFVTAGDFVAPAWQSVPSLVDEMCARANALADDPIGAAAWLLWRVNWIHPFFDGNGRVARELSYLALLAGFQFDESSDGISLPEFLDQRRDDYYAALRDADRRAAAGDVPETILAESLISAYLVERESGLDPTI